MFVCCFPTASLFRIFQRESLIERISYFALPGFVGGFPGSRSIFDLPPSSLLLSVQLLLIGILLSLCLFQNRFRLVFLSSEQSECAQSRAHRRVTTSTFVELLSLPVAAARSAPRYVAPLFLHPIVLWLDLHFSVTNQNKQLLLVVTTAIQPSVSFEYFANGYRSGQHSFRRRSFRVALLD